KYVLKLLSYFLKRLIKSIIQPAIKNNPPMGVRIPQPPIPTVPFILKRVIAYKEPLKRTTPVIKQKVAMEIILPGKYCAKMPAAINAKPWYIWYFTPVSKVCKASGSKTFFN